MSRRGKSEESGERVGCEVQSQRSKESKRLRSQVKD